MGTALISTSGLIPTLFGLIGVLAALQYLKGMVDFSKAVKQIFMGFAFIFLAKLLIFFAGYFKQGDNYSLIYYFIFLMFHMLSAVFLIAGGFSIKGSKFFSKTIIIFSCLAAAVWSWYVVIITYDGNALMLSLALSTIGYAVLAASLWRRKSLRNSLGFVLTGWFCIFLVLYNLLKMVSWGQSLQSPEFETFLYIGIMCGFVMISNNMMAHQFDALAQEAEENKERLRLMIQLSPFPIIISRLKDDQLMMINKKAGELFGLDTKKPGNFKTIDYFAEPAKRGELLAKLEKNPVVDDFEFLVKPRKGEPFWLLLSARVIDFEYEIALYMAFQDITGRKQKELQLFDQATRDPLTNCYNRRQFEELAKNEVQRSRRYKHSFCIFMIDADHFKKVNDTYGHATGDLVLQALADCCRRALRESDIISRFGGEEFVILLPEATLENAHRVAERLRIKISKLVVKSEDNKDVRFTVSIGLVPSTLTDDISEMLKLADEALYAAKENGRNQVVIYEEGGPNTEFPVPIGEDMEKVNAEPLYYFAATAAAPSSKPEEHEESEGVIFGLDNKQNFDDSLLGDEDTAGVAPIQGHGVSLEELFDEDEDDGVIINRPVPPPVIEEEYDEEYVEEELPLEEELIDTPEDELLDEELSSEIEEEEDFSDETLSEAQEDQLEEELMGAPTEEEELPPEPPLEDEDELSPEPELPAFSMEDVDSLLADIDILTDEPEEAESFEPPLEDEEDVMAEGLPTEEPIIEDDLEFETEEEDSSFTPPPSPAAAPPPSPAAKAPVMKMPMAMVKKLPIKMPPGMVKAPKMPGVVRMKIPKTLQQGAAPVVPGDDNPTE